MNCYLPTNYVIYIGKSLGPPVALVVPVASNRDSAACACSRGSAAARPPLGTVRFRARPGLSAVDGSASCPHLGLLREGAGRAGRRRRHAGGGRVDRGAARSRGQRRHNVGRHAVGRHAVSPSRFAREPDRPFMEVNPGSSPCASGGEQHRLHDLARLGVRDRIVDCGEGIGRDQFFERETALSLQGEQIRDDLLGNSVAERDTGDGAP